MIPLVCSMLLFVGRIYAWRLFQPPALKGISLNDGQRRICRVDQRGRTSRFGAGYKAFVHTSPADGVNQSPMPKLKAIPVPLRTGAEYLGCYQDMRRDRVLTSMLTSDSMDAAVCVSYFQHAVSTMRVVAISIQYHVEYCIMGC